MEEMERSVNWDSNGTKAAAWLTWQREAGGGGRGVAAGGPF